MKIDNRPVKSHVAESFPPTHPARAVFAGLPDFMEERELDAQLPILVRVLKVRAEEGGPT